MDENDRYHAALGRATHKLSDVEGFVYLVAVRLSRLPLREAKLEFSGRTMGQLVRAAIVLAHAAPLEGHRRDSMLRLLARAEILSRKRNDLLHSDHAYAAADLSRVLVRKDGKHPASLGIAGKVTAETFDEIAAEAHQLWLDIFEWFSDGRATKEELRDNSSTS